MREPLVFFLLVCMFHVCAIASEPIASNYTDLPEVPVTDVTYNGLGIQMRADYARYIGEFRDGKPNGQGTMTWPDGRKYVGEFKDDNQNGQGTMTWRDDKKYVGEFKNGHLGGQGTMTWPDGTKYVGVYLSHSLMSIACKITSIQVYQKAFTYMHNDLSDYSN